MKLCDGGNETVWCGPEHTHAKWQKCDLEHGITDYGKLLECRSCERKSNRNARLSIYYCFLGVCACALRDVSFFKSTTALKMNKNVNGFKVYLNNL